MPSSRMMELWEKQNPLIGLDSERDFSDQVL